MELFIVFIIGIFLGSMGALIAFKFKPDNESRFIDNGNVKIKPKPTLEKEDVPDPPLAVIKKMTNDNNS